MSFGSMRLIVVLLLVSVSAADDIAKEWARKFQKSAVRGQLLDSIPRWVWKELSAKPESLYLVAHVSALMAPTAAAKDPDTWRRFTRRLEKAATAIPESARDEAHAHGVLGATGLCRGHVNAATGEAFDPQIWREAADHFLSAHTKSPGAGKYLEHAVRTLDDAARIGADPATKTEALALCFEGAKKYPHNQYFAKRRHAVMLHRIADTAKKKRSEAKRMLQGYLNALESGKYGTGVARDTAHTSAVTFARLHKKLGVKPKYRTTVVSIGSIWMEIPKGRQWEKTGSRVNQYDENGELVRTIRTDSYRWDTNYYLGSKIFGGDNTKGLARIGEADVLTVVTQVSHRKKVVRTKLSRKIGSTVGFEIGGLDNEGRYLCYRWYYFKSERKRLTSLMVDIVDYMDTDKLDPEFKFVRSTLREGR